MSQEEEDLSLHDTLEVPDFEVIDRFVNLTDAARILGYSSYQSVKTMIERKELRSYKIPNQQRSRILLSDLMQIIESSKNSPSVGEENNSGHAASSDSPKNNSSGKKSVGRPRKFSS